MTMEDNGMVDLQCDYLLTRRVGPTDFGMVEMDALIPNAKARCHLPPPKKPAAPLTVDIHSQIIVASANAVTLASDLALKSTNSDEKDFWLLYKAILADAERSQSYFPEKIGIDLRPAGSQSVNHEGPTSMYSASRLWYISHFAYLQDLLMRQPTLRHITLILRWLEDSYGERFGGYRNFRFAGRAQNTEEVTLMREAIRSALRSGKVSEAIRIAETADDGVTACMISAAQMKAHPEAWNTATTVVPLFGEYANGDEPLEWGKACHGTTPNEPKPWTTNRDRIDQLSNLLEWSEMEDVDTDEAVIAAILSGNEEVLSAAFDTKRWQDELWVAARCALIKIFSRAISSNGEPIISGPFRNRFEAYCPPDASWAEAASRKLTQSISSICDRHLANSLLGGGMNSLPFTEELQLRLILQTLNDGNASLFEAACTPATIPLFAAVQLVSWRAKSDGLIRLNPQTIRARSASQQTLMGYTLVISEYCSMLLTSPRMDPKEGVQRACQLLFTITDNYQRAKAVAELVLAARTLNYYSYNGQGETLTTSTGSGTQKITNAQRRAHAGKREQELMELVRKVNIKRFSQANDSKFVSELLSSLGARVDEAHRYRRSMGKSMDGSPTMASQGKSFPPLLASDEKAEAQLWRIYLWQASFSLGHNSLEDTAKTIHSICVDVTDTVTNLWCAQRHFKAIKEVMNAYSTYVATSVLEAIGNAEGEQIFAPTLSVIKELFFWELMADILGAWDVLSTLAVEAPDLLNRSASATQLAAAAADEQKYRKLILGLTIQALAFESHFVQHKPTCVGALLKCAEINANAALVGINFPRQAEPIALICQSARDQILLLHSAIAVASKEDTQDLFKLFRMLRLDAGVAKLASNVAAALA